MTLIIRLLKKLSDLGLPCMSIRAATFTKFGWLVGFVALRPKSTAMVIAGRSVQLTTHFPGQA